MNRVDVGRAAQAACILEAVSVKPGNVNRLFDFADTTLADFLLSAVMIGHYMEQANRYPVGETILDAVRATRKVVTCNTNLGIILLFVPLAKACGTGDLRNSVREVLSSLTVADAVWTCAAIRLAAPGGMGSVPTQDIAHDPDITLLELMSLAGERDAVAREYGTGFAITFELAYPALVRYLKSDNDFSSAVVNAYLAVLAEVPDTLIARKKGLAEAQAISRMAGEALHAGGLASESGRERVRQFDAVLRSDGNVLNPGTTADLIAAAVFAFFLQQGLSAMPWMRGWK